MTSFRLSRTFFESFWRFYRSAAVLSNFLLYHSLERLSRSFSTFFIRSVAAYQRQLLDCNTLSCACQQLFEFLQASVGRAAYLADSLVRIPDLSAFVNPFFNLFLFFWISVITAPYRCFCMVLQNPLGKPSRRCYNVPVLLFYTVSGSYRYYLYRRDPSADPPNDWYVWETAGQYTGALSWS